MSCWSCGQKANGSCTCTVCNVARYCGTLCLHKDWDSHQKVCGLTKARPSFRPFTASGPAAKTTTDHNSSTTGASTRQDSKSVKVDNI